jgi:hypothetical protein
LNFLQKRIMDKSLLHLSADICGLFLVAMVTLAAKPATAEPNPVTSPASAKVPSSPEKSPPNATIVAPSQSPTTPTVQVNIVKSKSPPQNSLPQNSLPQNSLPQDSPPQNSPPVAIDPSTVVNGVPTTLVPGSTSTAPIQQSLSSELPSPKLQSGQVNVGNYLFVPARSIATPTISTASSNDSSNQTNLSSEAAQKTTTPDLPIQARLNAAQQAYDRAAVKLAELRQASTPGVNTTSPELVAAQQAERIAAEILSQVQADARQLMGSLKSHR